MVTSCCIHEALSQMNTGPEFNSVCLLMWSQSEEISFELIFNAEVYVSALMLNCV